VGYKIRSQSKRATRLLHPAVTLAIVNFAALLAGSAHFRGTALNGYSDAGRYFVCLHSHSSCTAVSSATWHYSYWQALLTIALFTLVVAASAVFIRTGDIELE
jgi:hypothetical protein